MRRRCKQHEAGRLLGIGEREGGRLGRAERMADDNRLVDADRIHQRGQRLCLAERRIVFARAAFGPAEPRPVEEQQFGAAFEQRPQRHHLVPEIGAGAVDEDDWRQVGLGRARHMHEVNARAVGDDEVADRRIAALDLPHAKARDPRQHEHQSKQQGDRSGDDVHALGSTGKGGRELRRSATARWRQMPSPASSSDSVATSFWALRIIG